MVPMGKITLRKVRTDVAKHVRRCVGVPKCCEVDARSRNGFVPDARDRNAFKYGRYDARYGIQEDVSHDDIHCAPESSLVFSGEYPKI